MNKQDVLLQSIRSAYPDLRIASVEYNGDGQNNDVLVVSGEFIFRFPKYADALKRLKLETAILTGIQSHVSLPVPAPVFVNIEGRVVGEAFMGYRRLAGEPLWRVGAKAIYPRWCGLQMVKHWRLTLQSVSTCTQQIR